MQTQAPGTHKLSNSREHLKANMLFIAINYLENERLLHFNCLASLTEGDWHAVDPGFTAPSILCRKPTEGCRSGRPLLIKHILRSIRSNVYGHVRSRSSNGHHEKVKWMEMPNRTTIYTEYKSSQQQLTAVLLRLLKVMKTFILNLLVHCFEKGLYAHFMRFHRRTIDSQYFDLKSAHISLENVGEWGDCSLWPYFAIFLVRRQSLWRVIFQIVGRILVMIISFNFCERSMLARVIFQIRE